jgi:hypothetical protein
MRGISVSTSIRQSSYKDQRAVTLESGVISAQFLPAVGANLCSLIYKPRGLELLIQRPGAGYKVASYAGDYVADGECAGMDDMFPTIDRCFYDRYPWQGTPIPDHGEVWSLPWEWAIEGERLHLTTWGVRFPYRLEKWISFTEANVLHIAYRLTNVSAFNLDFLWAAHPMFILEEGAELILPEGVECIVNMLSYSGELGGYGNELAWPVARLRNGGTLDLRHIRPKQTCDLAKYYVKGRLPEGWCALTYPQSHLTLTLSFPVAQVPYLAVLPNEGAWQDLYNIFLEPATATFDRPDIARLHGQCSTVQGHGAYEWYLDIALSEGRRA